MLYDQTFKTVISSTPLISIGGRVYKNETINSASIDWRNNYWQSRECESILRK